MTEPLLHFLTACVIALIDRLRFGCEARIWSFFTDPSRHTPAHARRMIQEVKQGERRLWREIREGALKELGIAFERLPLEAYARPKSRSPAALRARVRAYLIMLRDPEACVRRLVAKLRADMKLSMLDRMRGPMQGCIETRVAPRLIPLRMPRIVERTHPRIHPP